MNWIKNLLKDAILVSTNVIRLYSCIAHVAGLKALKNALELREDKSVPTEKLLRMADFVLKNNIF